MEKLQPPAPSTEIVPAEPVEEVTEEKAVQLLEDLPAEQQTALAERAGNWVEQVSSLNPHSQEFKAQVDAINTIAQKTFDNTAGTSSRFMQSSLRDAKGSGSKSQEKVASDLANLRNTMEDLAPKQETFADKAFGWIPGRNSVKRYFRTYESNQEQINQVLVSLARGQEGLQRDNAELAVERRSLWDDLGALQRASVLLSQLDEQVVARAAQENAAGNAEVAHALEKDVLFAVRQRRQDVQTQIAVTVQAYMAMGLIEDNNSKLIQGVERARTTTVTALRTAVITAQALENQKLVLDQIDAVNRTTNDLINRTSDLLEQNSVRVQQQATESGVSPETLQRAFDSLFTTMDNIDQFRSQANQNFLTTISNLEKQVERAQPYLDRMEGQAIPERAQLTAGPALLEVD